MSWEQDLRLGREALFRAQFEVAEMRLRSALATAYGDFWYPVEEIAEIQSSLAEALLLKGCYAEAKQLFEDSEDFFGNAVDSVEGISRTINWYGLAEIYIQHPESKEKALEFFKKAAVNLRLCSGYRQPYLERARAFISGIAEMPLLPWEKTETLRSHELRKLTELISVPADMPQDRVNRYVEWEKLLEQAGNCRAKETPEDTLEAYMLANEALELATTLFPMNHPASALTVMAMASASGALRMTRQAEDLFLCAIEIFEQVEGKDSVEAAIAKLNFAHFYRKAEMYSIADIQFRSAAEILNEHEDVDQESFQQNARVFCDMLTAWESIRGAKALLQQGKEKELAQQYEAALMSYLEAKRLLADHFPSNHNACLLVQESIKQIYENCGWAEEAQKLSNEIEAIKSALDAQEIAWRIAITAAPPLAIAKKAA